MLAVLILLTGCADSEKYGGKVHRRDGVLYADNSTEPLNAEVETLHTNGSIRGQYTVVDGKIEGTMYVWRDSGQLREEYNYRNGKLDGQATRWGSYGQLVSEGSWVNGEREGIHVHHHEGGGEECWKAGLQVAMSECY